MNAMQSTRRLPVGAEVVSDGVHFRVWAPNAKRVEVVFEKQNSHPDGGIFALQHEEKSEGYFSGLVNQAADGSLYQYRLNEVDFFYPDPASRYQPRGPHGPSQVIDPKIFPWSDQQWKGVTLEGRVIYELHIGTFTHQGTWESAKRELLELADLGITIIEMMPVNEFPGKFGWGYDGVNLFAPTHLYGAPQDLKDFIDHSHALGIAVILDVVYNHFGPDGNYLKSFSDHYFTNRNVTEWGEAINFDGPGSKGVREFYIANAGYWIEEYHFDGLRIDATQNIYDKSSPHILLEINDQVRKSASHRHTYLIAESETQQSEIVRPREEGGYGFDAVWNDDFHHSAIVRLTGHNECYYNDYFGAPQEFISAIKYGYLYQGQWYLWHQEYRGTPAFDLDPAAFINFIQNHDQIANSAHGLRLHLLTDPGNYRAMTALMLLAPGTPMLFQGQEFAASTPFYYFADHVPELAQLIFQGRRDYFKKFPSIGTPEIQAGLPIPADMETFVKSKLNFLDRELHSKEYALHRDLLRIRRNDSVFSILSLRAVDGAVLSQDAFLIRYFGEDVEDTRLLLVNFGVDFPLTPAPEPLLAAPHGTQWEILWSSEDSRYGGGGTPPMSTNNQWRVLGHATMVLIPKKKETVMHE
jgi:maltooligosyltrehalose trehalohydrolase